MLEETIIKKEERNQEMEAKEHIWKIGTTIFAILFVITLSTWLLTEKETSPITGETTRVEMPVDVTVDDDPFLGDEDASVTIIEFSDAQCQYCKQFWIETFPLLRKEYITTGKVRFVMRDLPMKESGHAWSGKAAEAAECAHNQGKFWELQDKIFANQNVLNSMVQEVDAPEKAKMLVITTENNQQKYLDIALAVSHIKHLAGEVHVKMDVFNRCLDTGQEAGEIEKDKNDAEKAGVQSTPTFFINGEKVAGALPFIAYQKIIEKELFE